MLLIFGAKLCLIIMERKRKLKASLLNIQVCTDPGWGRVNFLPPWLDQPPRCLKIFLPKSHFFYFYLRVQKCNLVRSKNTRVKAGSAPHLLHHLGRRCLFIRRFTGFPFALELGAFLMFLQTCGQRLMPWIKPPFDRIPSRVPYHKATMTCDALSLLLFVTVHHSFCL